MDSSASHNMKEVERRERHLWVLVFGLILVLSGLTVMTYFTIVDEAYPIYSLWRTVSTRALGGLSVLIFLFCAYVVQTRKIIGRMRSDQENQAMIDHLTDLCFQLGFQAGVILAVRGGGDQQATFFQIHTSSGSLAARVIHNFRTAHAFQHKLAEALALNCAIIMPGIPGIDEESDQVFLA